MKKTTKGAVAAGAAALLLAGGAGSFAAWNASTTPGGNQTVTAGSMSVKEADGSGVWKLGAAVVDDLTTVKIVPGDVLTYTATYDYTLVGTNLKATLKPTLSGIADENALGNQLLVSTTGGDEVVVTTSGSQSVTTTITFDPKAGTFDNTAQGQSVSLAGGMVTLEQKLGG